MKDVVNEHFNERRLIDGTTSHGTQSLDKSLAYLPMSYYRKNTGVALAFQQLREYKGFKPLSVGFIGLGAGTLAAYGKENDSFRFL